MAGPWPRDLVPTFTRFHRRYEVGTVPEIVRVDVHGRRIHIDAVLASLATVPNDLALWVVASRNLVCVRTFFTPVTEPILQWWQVAWVLAHAANSYNFPRTTTAAMFPDTDVLGCVLSLSWSKLLLLPVPASIKWLLQTIPKAAESYTSWMVLGERLLPYLSPPAMPLPFASETPGAATTEDIGDVDDDNGLSWVRIPDVTATDIRWAIDALSEWEREHVFPVIPAPKMLDALANVIHEIDDLVPVSRYGHIGRREVVRHAFGVPVFSGVRMEPETEHRPWSVYVDVSTSMTAYTSVAWGFLRSLPSGSKAYAFSGVVVEADIHSDRVQSNGYTNYVAVAEHILANDIRNIIVVSDDTEPLPPKLVKALREHCDIVYVSVRDGVKPESTLSDAACSHIILPNT